MDKLSKSEFMSKAINDIYEFKRLEKEKSMGAEIHEIQNFHKINQYKRRKKR